MTPPNTKLPADQLKTRLDLARQITLQAGQATLEFFQSSGLEVQRKSDNSPVTVADRQAEQLLRREISAKFPSDGVLGEEYPESPGSSGYRWILDPIDGTKTFISGVPLYGTLVGVEYQRQSVAGVIYIPALDEMVFAAKGQGAWYCKNQGQLQPAKVSQRDKLAEGLFLTSQVDSFEARGAEEAFLRLQKAAYITRTWGDCYGYLLVATGRAEAMVDPEMNVWDAAAIQPILEEAGGTFTDWQGQATIHGGEGVATNGLVSDEVLSVTRHYPKPA